MKPQPLWKISVTTSAEAEDAVGAALENLFASAVSAYANEKTKVSAVSVYLADAAAVTPAKLKALRAGLKIIKAAGLNLGDGKVSVQRLARENWAESWKRHFKPIAVGDALLLKPSWSKRRPRRGQAVVVLDPGLSFGTGHHATTGFCLAQLVKYRFGFRVPGSRSKAPCTKNSKLSFLDIGTGSGILAIVAAKLGYAPVTAFDFDPESVRVAKENAQKNRVENILRLRQQDLTKLPLHSAQKYDFVCANLISNLLIAERDRIVNRLRPGGVLVLAGILRPEFGLVQTAYGRRGFKLLAARNEKEWRSGALQLLI